MNWLTVPGVEEMIAGVLFNIILALLSAFSAYAVAWLRAHVSQKHLTLAMRIADAAVRAAESVGTAYGYDSKAKFEYALNAVRQVAASHGLKFSDEQWEALIEQAHHTLVVTENELASGPTVDPAEPPIPEPAGPPGPQTAAGQEHTGVIDASAPTQAAIPEPTTSDVPSQTRTAKEAALAIESDTTQLPPGAFRRPER